MPGTRSLSDKEVTKMNKNEVEQAKRRKAKETETNPGLVERGRRVVVRS